MMRKNHAFKLGLSIIILGTILILACDRSQSEFEKTRQLNTIEAYNSFIKKYSTKPLANEAINLRDQLAFEMTADSTTTDSLAPLKPNILENLVANAEQKWLDAKNNQDDDKAVDELVSAAKFYHRAARIQHIVGNDSTEAYKKSAYAYYRALLRSQAVHIASLTDHLKILLIAPDKFETLALLSLTVDLINYLNKKRLFYDSSANLFRKAGLEKHADWMTEGKTVKIFDWADVESAPDSSALKTKK